MSVWSFANYLTSANTTFLLPLIRLCWCCEYRDGWHPGNGLRRPHVTVSAPPLPPRYLHHGRAQREPRSVHPVVSLQLRLSKLALVCRRNLGRDATHSTEPPPPAVLYTGDERDSLLQAPAHLTEASISCHECQPFAEKYLFINWHSFFKYQDEYSSYKAW